MPAAGCRTIVKRTIKEGQEMHPAPVCAAVPVLAVIGCGGGKSGNDEHKFFRPNDAMRSIGVHAQKATVQSG